MVNQNVEMGEELSHLSYAISLIHFSFFIISILLFPKIDIIYNIYTNFNFVVLFCFPEPSYQVHQLSTNAYTTLLERLIILHRNLPHNQDSRKSLLNRCQQW